MKEKSLELLYAEWRQASEIMIRDGHGNYDIINCGFSSVREDFSSFCELGRIISFEEMLELEIAYEKKY